MSSDHHVLQFISGEFRSGRGTASTQVIDPASEETVAQGFVADDADVDESLKSAVDGFHTWRKLTALERALVLRKGAALLRERSEGIARLLTCEQGKTLAEARRELTQAADSIEWHADEGRRAYGRVVPSRWPGAKFTVEPQPVGPVAAITPWNFPVMLSATKISAALAAGCSVILKPADETPLAATELVRALNDAGLPAGALQMLVGAADRVCARLIASDEIQKISFTGSTRVGRLLASQAAQRLKPITLELGGHAPVIVCEDADVEKTVATLSGIKFRNAGQICANPSRFYVHRSVVARFERAMVAAAEAQVVGPGLNDAVTMGPLASPRRLSAIESMVSDAMDHGAVLLSGGRRLGDRGCFFAPTVLTAVPDVAQVMNEEPFGPLVPIRAFDALDEALALANGLAVGLAAFGFTSNLKAARRMTDELKAGAVGINCVTLMQPETPFGGVEDSGHGRENGTEGLAAYLSTRTLAIAA